MEDYVPSKTLSHFLNQCKYSACSAQNASRFSIEYLYNVSYSFTFAFSIISFTGIWAGCPRARCAWISPPAKSASRCLEPTSLIYDRPGTGSPSQESAAGYLRGAQAGQPAGAVLDRAMDEVVQVLKCDNVLTAKLLRACNSPYFGLEEPVSSVDQAVFLLGHQQILHIVLTLAFGSAMVVSVAWVCGGGQ